MNSALAGLLGGVQGGASEYNTIQSDQRKYNMENKRSQQELMRKESFARFQYSLQDSGMRDKDGRVVNNEQATAGGEFESAAAQKAKITEQARVDAEGRADGKKAALLTEKESKAAILLKEKNDRDDRIRKESQDRYDKRADKKEEADATKAKTAKEKAFVTDGKKAIRENIKNTSFPGAPFTAKIEGAMEFYGTNRDNPMVEMIPEIMSASKVYKNSIKFHDIFEGEKGFWKSRKAEIAEAKKKLKANGMSTIDIEQAVRYLEGKGSLD